jgi:DedD protein
LKKRLVGAAVLVSLIVIFVPMILSGPLEPGTGDLPEMIPARPFSQLNRPDASALEDEISRLKVPAPLPSTSTSTSASAYAEPPAQPHSIPSGNERDQPRTQSALSEQSTSTSSSTPPLSDSGVNTAMPNTKASHSISETPTVKWVIQVGSFSSESNALALRERLKKSGFLVFVEPFKNQDKTHYRVRVGPVESRDSADVLAQKLTSQEQLPAHVLSL